MSKLLRRARMRVQKRRRVRMPFRALTWYAFHQAGTWFVAGRWRLLDGSLSTLAEILACSEADAITVGLHRAPLPEEDLGGWAARVAHATGLDYWRVRVLAEHLSMVAYHTGGATRPDQPGYSLSELSGDYLRHRHAFDGAPAWFVAGRWRRLGGTLPSLAATLACPESNAIKVGLCRAPRPGEDLDAWSRTIAEYAGLDVERVRALAERLTVW